MRTQIISTCLIIIATLGFAACNGGGDTHGGHQQGATEQTAPATGHQHEEGMVYQCPMKCEGERVYDQPGRCPVCKMELKPVEDHTHQH